MFEKATRTKLRFSYHGQIGVEDLWDLGVNELDKIYSRLRAEEKAETADSLLKKATRESTVRNLQLQIVEHIVTTKLAENEATKARLDKKNQKEKIASIIAKKQDESLENMSIDDLKKEMEAL